MVRQHEAGIVWCIRNSAVRSPPFLPRKRSYPHPATDTFARVADPTATTFAGGDALALSGIFSVTFDPGTLQVFVSKVQGIRDEAVDYPVDLQGYTGSQVDVLTPALPHQGTFDLYASALNPS